MVSIIDCINIGSPFNKKFYHSQMTFFPITIYRAMQRRHPGLVLQVHIATLIKKIFNNPNISIVNMTE